LVRECEKGGDALLRVKAVPGASRDQISGRLGNRLKVRVSAPPEGGKANKAICAMLARALDVRKSDVAVVEGLTAAEKTVRLSGVTAEQVLQALYLD